MHGRMLMEKQSDWRPNFVSFLPWDWGGKRALKYLYKFYLTRVGREMYLIFDSEMELDW